MNKDLESLRQQISDIDKKILDLLTQRMSLSKKVELKKRSTENSKIFIPEIEDKKISLLCQNSKGKLNPKFVKILFKKIFIESRKIQAEQRKKAAK